jgi:hypothetical protein
MAVLATRTGSEPGDFGRNDYESAVLKDERHPRNRSMFQKARMASDQWLFGAGAVLAVTGAGAGVVGVAG